MEFRSIFRTWRSVHWKDASRRPIPDRWLFRATVRLGHLEEWRNGRTGGMDPFGVKKLGQRGAAKSSKGITLLPLVP